ncbi:MAG: hypothetical protein ABI035_03240 [Gemmatimonadaceae bacterium]
MESAKLRIKPFSLFDRDLLNRSFSRIGLDSRRASHLALRSLIVIGLTWVPMAVLAYWQRLYSIHVDARNFFADYAAYAQFLIAIPLFIVGERIISSSTLRADKDFVESGVVRDEDRPTVDSLHAEVERLRLSRVAEAVCIALAYVTASATILPELTTHSILTWHTGSGPGGNVQTFLGLTAPGAWALLVALPILNYWWLRIAWKIIIWTRYLYGMSRLKLVLVASHPDSTGGIGFISEVQSTFAVIIFAYGISNVAAVIAYKVAIEHAPLSLMPVWAPALGFIVCAPLLFTLPLLMFTKQLSRTKHRAVALCRAQLLRRTQAFETRSLNEDLSVGAGSDSAWLASMNNLNGIFERIEQMRVVPFDFKSATQLLASTIGSVATALPLLKFQGPLKEWLELLSSVMRHGS